MNDAFVNTEELFDAESYWRAGNCPWTFFAFPSSLADAQGFPPDEDAKRFLAELQRRGIRVGIWANGIVENTTYFACPMEDIQRLRDAVYELENTEAFGSGFCAKRSEHLFSLHDSGT